MPGNKRDDDNNGFVDDTWGWNLIGGPDGRNVDKDTYEVARLAAQCTDTAQKRKMVRYQDQCDAIIRELQEKRAEAEGILNQVRQIEGFLARRAATPRRSSRSARSRPPTTPCGRRARSSSTWTRRGSRPR
jgi:hypothetical protein